MKKTVMTSSGVEIRINIMDLDPDEEEVRAEVFVDGNFRDLFEYAIDGILDRSSGNAWSRGANEGLAVLLSEYFGNDRDLVREKIYDAVEALLGSSPVEKEVSNLVGESGLVLLGRDPENHNRWHIGRRTDAGEVQPLAHFHSLKELTAWHEENYLSERALFKRYRTELGWSRKETARRFARTEREIENWEYDDDAVPIEALWLIRLLTRIKGTRLGDEEGI